MYEGIPYQVKQGTGDRGITAENTENSQHTDFNEDTTNESASVTCSNVRLWKLDFQKEWRNTSWRLWDERTEKDSAGLWTAKTTNEWVLNKARVKRELLDTVKARKLAYYGHTMRKQGSCLEKEIVQGQWRRNGDKGGTLYPPSSGLYPLYPQVKDAAYVKILSKRL